MNQHARQAARSRPDVKASGQALNRAAAAGTATPEQTARHSALWKKAVAEESKRILFAPQTEPKK